MKPLLARKKKVNSASIGLCIIAAIFLSGCGSDANDNAAGSPVSTPNLPPIASDIAPYDGSNPYENVVSFIGDAYDDTDPDTKWLKTTKEKLDNMSNDQYLTREEYDQIIQRQTEIQYKYDRLSEYYQQLKDMQSATIDPYTAVEFKLESFCLNVRLKIPASDTTYDEVIPMEEHIQKILEYALPDGWRATPYSAKNSKEDGIVCDQYVHWVYEEAGLDYPPTPTWRMPSSPFFTETPKTNAKDGDIILWLSYDKKIHHMGIWVEYPANYGGLPDFQTLSARTHGGKSKLPVSDPNFIPTVDWTKINDFSVDYRVFRFKGADPDAPDCPLR